MFFYSYEKSRHTVIEECNESAYAYHPVTAINILACLLLVFEVFMRRVPQIFKCASLKHKDIFPVNHKTIIITNKINLINVI